jgi:hypothetical protein
MPGARDPAAVIRRAEEALELVRQLDALAFELAAAPGASVKTLRRLQLVAESFERVRASAQRRVRLDASDDPRLPRWPGDP